jgi:hypothetical protein
MALALLALALVATPVAAATRQPLTEQLAAFDVPDPADPVRDAVIERANPPLSRTSATSEGRSYRIDGATASVVSIQVSSLCASPPLAGGCNPPADPAALAGFLATLPHGSELDLLRVLMVTQAEITSICGPGTLACYFPSQNQMVVRGNAFPPAGGVSRDFVVAHEYGHHLANHRRNSPWDALAWGPKRWATFERVCQGVVGGVYFPGDQGAHYFENPGEAFAEAYAFGRFPAETPWAWISSLQPTVQSIEKIRDDAFDPWNGPQRLRWRGRLGTQRNSVTRSFATPLDGNLTARLKSARGTSFNLRLLGAGSNRLLRVVNVASRRRVALTVCGASSIRLRVGRRRGAGRFTVTVFRP